MSWRPPWPGFSMIPKEARAAGDKARELAMAKRGAVASMVGEILKAAGESLPNPMRTLAARLLLTPLTWAWTARTSPESLASPGGTKDASNQSGECRRPDHGRGRQVSRGGAPGRRVFTK